MEADNLLVYSHSYSTSKGHTCGLFEGVGNYQFVTVVTAHPNSIAVSCVRERVPGTSHP